jgi:hypothetical protein
MKSMHTSRRTFLASAAADAELTDMVRKEIEVWDKVIREADIHVN